MTQEEAPKAMSKSELVAELATGSGLSKAAIARVLDDLANIAYRETAKGFTVPGICKLTVSHRRARRSRNPKTGQALMIGAHDVVTIKALKKAKDLIAPQPDGLVTIVSEPAPSAAPAPQAEPELQVTAQPHAAADAVKPVVQTEAPVQPDAAEIWFLCPGCSVEISCPVSSAGEQASCPSCKCGIIIPSQSGGTAKLAAPAQPAPAAQPASEPEGAIVLFRCPECSQEIEAPAEVAGQQAECPACGIILKVPKSSADGIERAARGSAIQKAKETNARDQLSRTIRIDLDEVFK